MIPNWEGRISPVFDVAKSVLLVDIEDARESGRSIHQIDSVDPLARSAQLSGLGTEVLICCAISRLLEMALTSAGIRVIGQICGPVENVLEAFLRGQLKEGEFLMPGCFRRGRRFRGRRCRGRSKR